MFMRRLFAEAYESWCLESNENYIWKFDNVTNIPVIIGDANVYISQKKGRYFYTRKNASPAKYK